MEREYHGDEINLLEYWTVIKKYKKIICAIIGGTVFSVAIISLTLPKYYKAEAVIMPINDRSGGGGLESLESQFGGLVSLAGLGGGKTTAMQFIELLRTRTLAEEVIQENNLLPVIFNGKIPSNQGLAMEIAVNTLRSNFVNFSDDKKGATIRITAEFTEPQLAAKVANSYVKSLQKLINENSFTMAKRNRKFIENRLSENKRDLLQAGKELNEFYKDGRISEVESQVDVGINEAGDEFSRRALGKNTAEMVDLDAEIGDKFTNLQERVTSLNEEMVVKKVPQQVFLQYLALKRNLLTQINTLLTQQYEMAKIEEAKEDLSFQVIDFARVPQMKSKPKRSRLVLVSFAVSLFASIAVALALNHRERARQLKV